MTKGESVPRGAPGRPLVSVIVPAYRHEKYIEQALDSCLASGYPNLELVIANDASPEKDDERIRSWLSRNREAKVRYFTHETNRGVTRTFNECINLCTGAFIALLAGDDLLLPGSLEKRVRYLESHPDKLAVFTDCGVIDQDGNPLFESGIEGLYRHKDMRRRALLDDKLLPLEIVFHWGVPGPVFMARKEAYTVVGRYDERLAMEDWDMYLRLASVGKLGFLDESTALYRWHASNLVKVIDSKQTAEIRGVATRAAPRFRGLARIYLAAFGAIGPSDPAAPLPDRVRAKLVRYVVRYCERGYDLYRARRVPSASAASPPNS